MSTRSPYQPSLREEAAAWVRAFGILVALYAGIAGLALLLCWLLR